VVTKYYYAGAQRIAMRSSGTLYFMFGDHLGSTSLITFANGNVVSETRYKAWGEVRHSSAYTPTKYTYTGQYSYMDDLTTSGSTEGFGLMFYNARWYDSSLGRFAQADTIVPGGVQGYDRYAYVNNSPLKYTDPSGHDAWWCEGNDLCMYDWLNNNTTTGGDGYFVEYGVEIDEDWDRNHKRSVIAAISIVGAKFAETVGGTSAGAFRAAYGLNDGDTFMVEWDENCWGCRADPTGCDAGTTRGDACVAGFGYTNTENHIEFASMSDVEVPLRNVNNVIHELGHAFNLRLGRTPENALAVNQDLLRNEVGFYGDPSNRTWEASSGTNGSETFADQFLGWVYGKWDSYDGFGPARAGFMNQMNGANGWVAQAAGLP
ncbi:MAG: RHS repeat-associated core domain-containing protein, partial [Anaerolineae bacterium]|nr:RHS repeat-associated core domain-containing protein [Anaerolineae bacterium]